MKIIDRLLDILNPNRNALGTAVSQSNDVKTQIDLIRIRAFQRITGRRLTTLEAGSLGDSNELSDMKKNLSPSRRLLRRGI